MGECSAGTVSAARGGVRFPAKAAQPPCDHARHDASRPAAPVRVQRRCDTRTRQTGDRRAAVAQSFAAAPLARPSHATLFTGMYPPRLGVRDNTGAPLSADFQTLAEILGERRLATGAFVASAVLAPRRGLNQGFGTYSMGTSPGCPGSPRARRQADDVVSEAVSWLADHDSAPFFVWVHLYDTHRPYQLPDDYARSYADPYAAAIAFEDAQIARLISHLEARNLLDDTLMVVAGDHGESLGEHGEDSHGMFIYRGASHSGDHSGPGVPPRQCAAASGGFYATVLTVRRWTPPWMASAYSRWPARRGLVAGSLCGVALSATVRLGEPAVAARRSIQSDRRAPARALRSGDRSLRAAQSLRVEAVSCRRHAHPVTFVRQREGQDRGRRA